MHRTVHPWRCRSDRLHKATSCPCSVVSAYGHKLCASGILHECDAQLEHRCSCAHDKLNKGTNVLIPVQLPPHGGGVWQELETGTTVQGPVEVRYEGQVPLAGHNIALTRAQPVFPNPKTKHATQPWSQGNRLVLAAYVSGGWQKAPLEEVAFLKSLAVLGLLRSRTNPFKA